MTTLKFRKVTQLPAIIQSSTIYLVNTGTNTFTIYLTDKTGTIIYRSPDSTDISDIVINLINELVNQPNGLVSLDLDGHIIGTISNTSSIDGQDGEWLSNNNLVWNTITQALFSIGATTSDPTRILLFNNLQGLLFKPSALTQVFTQIKIPFDIALNTDCHIALHWMPGSGANGTIRWGIEYSIAKGYSQQSFPATQTNYTHVAANSTVDLIRNMTTDLVTLNSTSIEPDSTLLLRVFRDGGSNLDTFLGNTSAWKVSLKYQRQRIGTRQNVPNFYT